MFDAAPSPGQNRSPLPPAQPSADGVPGPRTPVGAREERQTARDRPRGERDAFFDNAKYLAIVLVAMGHAWEPLKDDSRIVEAAYSVVYSFHMPAFIIISGFFSRSFDMRPDRLKRLITGVVVPYVLFETAYPLFKNLVTGSHEDISLLDPWYLTWFLVALFVWRLTTPVWKLVRRPLPLAVGIAMLATVSPEIGDDLDLQRVLQFLPYFVLGLCMKTEHFQLVRRRWVRIASVPVFAAALAFGWWAVPRMNTGWFYHRDSAQELGAPWWCGPVMTLALMGCSLALTAGFFAWVPRRRMWFTALGAGTLYGYLLHGFLVKLADYRGWYDHSWLHRPLGEILVTALAAAAVTALCTRPVRRLFRFAMEPSLEWAFRQDAAGPARERHEQREKASA
ncbi:acyltransferase family protein [Streptomyces echinatus]|uniref:Fucose 4-O-acetylase-like acetyltransferase n=1 Tax=Streptomyces echinatus TaxID=67293 RepID=A0A7W9PNN4_9ACTN|nr:acyltransferase family protein [Streptomyces echinatus]MBB5924971.1 fucose 4-O-acetylase-like acetyltransferase [Streptomyces echinatus]